MSLLTWIGNALLISVVQLMYLVGVLVAIGFTLGWLERQTQFYLTRTFGRRGPLITAWIGTPVHEMGHWIQCVLWGHKVTSIKLLQIHDPHGTLGYVEHKYNRNSLYQQVGNFFIGIGPIISGIGMLVLSMYLLVPQSLTTLENQLQQSMDTKQTLDLTILQTLAESVLAMGISLFSIDHLWKPTFWLFVILAICISSHIALSKADLKNAFQGLSTILLLLILMNLVATLIQIDTEQIINTLTKINAYLLSFSSIAILFSLLWLGVSFLLYQLRRS